MDTDASGNVAYLGCAGALDMMPVFHPVTTVGGEFSAHVRPDAAVNRLVGNVHAFERQPPGNLLRGPVLAYQKSQGFPHHLGTDCMFAGKTLTAFVG